MGNINQHSFLLLEFSALSYSTEEISREGSLAVYGVVYCPNNQVDSCTCRPDEMNDTDHQRNDDPAKTHLLHKPALIGKKIKRVGEFSKKARFVVLVELICGGYI